MTVGLLGKLLFRVDGTCAEDGYCMPNIEEEIATKASSGYRVLERIDSNQVSPF
ncbi:hypothetical protein J2S17_000378 [Cytobacillus purgationiresistens]|uniref:Uncharacterized protein n=1 Tax=Cytobacillus purgationiresistens TaxID=863449 RepID=A0ABU0AB79_9BACI|nr:hypothetical protein [Cytobacillus purgationiresistens]